MAEYLGEIFSVFWKLEVQVQPDQGKNAKMESC